MKTVLNVLSKLFLFLGGLAIAIFIPFALGFGKGLAVMWLPFEVAGANGSLDAENATNIIYQLGGVAMLAYGVLILGFIFLFLGSKLGKWSK